LPTLPDIVKHLWEYFQELSLSRRNYGWGVTQLTYTEIKAWSDLRGIQLDAWELDTLMCLDSVFMDVESKAAERRRQYNG
jgi:hypothetical protein